MHGPSLLDQVHSAIKSSDLEALKAVNIQGNNVSDLVDRQGASPAHHAARGGKVDILEYIIKEIGVSGTLRSHIGATPAHDAAATGNLEVLRWLLDNTNCQVSW